MYMSHPLPNQHFRELDYESCFRIMNVEITITWVIILTFGYHNFDTIFSAIFSEGFFF